MSKKRNKRNTKSFKKRINKRNQMMKNHLNHNPFDWFNGTLDKIFDWEKYQELNELNMKNFDVNETELKLKNYEKLDKVGNELIENIIKNKNVIRRLLKFMIKDGRIGFGKFSEFFQRFIYHPFNQIGNKYNKYFDEYYDFISEFSVGDIVKSKSWFEESDTYDEEIVLFRMMDENEYLNLLVGRPP